MYVITKEENTEPAGLLENAQVVKTSFLSGPDLYHILLPPSELSVFLRNYVFCFLCSRSNFRLFLVKLEISLIYSEMSISFLLF